MLAGAAAGAYLEGMAAQAGFCPLAGRRPPGDDDYFEALSAAVFQARLRPDIVRARGYPSESEGEGRDRLTVITAK